MYAIRSYYAITSYNVCYTKLLRDFEMGKELLGAVSSLAADPAVRCIVLTGAGRAFSAGGDVAMMGSFRTEAAEHFLRNNFV